MRSWKCYIFSGRIFWQQDRRQTEKIQTEEVTVPCWLQSPKGSFRMWWGAAASHSDTLACYYLVITELFLQRPTYKREAIVPVSCCSSLQETANCFEMRRRSRFNQLPKSCFWLQQEVTALVPSQKNTTKKTLRRRKMFTSLVPGVKLDKGQKKVAPLRSFFLEYQHKRK